MVMYKSLANGEVVQVYPVGYKAMLDAMRRSPVDVPGVIDDIRNCLGRHIDVSHGQTLAVIDFLIEKNSELKDSIHGLRSALDSVMGVTEKYSDQPVAPLDTSEKRGEN